MANVSVLNTTNQLSGKTIAVCENDQTISGAWTFTGNQDFQGNLIVGSASTDTVTVNATIVSNLIFTDATYDIGASGATRPRDLFPSRNAVVGGTLTVTGATILGTLGGNLLFTDATYDIGASGATRPRDLFLSRNATIGGTLSVAGDVTLTGTTPLLTIGDAGEEDAGITFDGNAQDFYIALDDSADDLVIGLGSAIGTTPIIELDENRVVTLSAGQLKFPASQNASTNANTLDDYEEGTFTPTANVITYDAGTTARYVKIGRMVHVQAFLDFPATGDTGQAKITNMPFTSVTSAVLAVGFVGGQVTNAAGCRVESNSTELTLRAAAGGANLTNANCSGQEVYVNITYEASA